MLITSVFLRFALLLALAAMVTALMVVRLTAGTDPGTTRATPPAPSAGHPQGSAAAERHAYRLRHEQALAAAAQ
jgi:hypothetical protein